MTKVTIDRDLLEHMRNFTVMSDSGVAGVLRGQIDAILANPTLQGEVVEVAQVVSYLSACADGYDPDAPHPGPPEPLMTVAQHQRILAARVPEGCKVVPVEATEDMEEAGCQAYMNADAAAWIMHRSSMGAAYKAMVAAADGGKLIPLELLMRVCAQPFDIEECMTIDRASALEELRALLACAEGVKDE